MAHVIADRVLESSVSAGAGPFTLAGAVLGFRAFTSVCAVTDTVPYYIEAVDEVGRPTGDYEFGLGTYSAANQLTRTTVRGSSNGGLAVSFSAGTKLVGLGVPAPNSAATRLEWRTSLGLTAVGEAVAIAADAAAARAAIGVQAASATVAGLVELATNNEAQAAVDSVRAVTPANLAATVLGMGQTTQSVFGSRSLNTPFVNNTGRTIFLSVTAIGNSSADTFMQLLVNGNQVSRVSLSYQETGVWRFIYGTISFPILPGQTYRVDTSGGSASLSLWNEVRT